MKKFWPFLLFILTVSSSSVFAQRQGNIWCFGYHVNIDFNTGKPIFLTPSAISTLEGSASIADPRTGALLFYSDGITVWNSNHQIMENGEGLLGHWSSTQSALIVPAPGDSLHYYLFTSDAQPFLSPTVNPQINGISYSIVDMRLDGGLGKVVEKNHSLFHDTATEKLIAIQHDNGHDYWIIAHEWNSNRFLVWLLTENGISDSLSFPVGATHYNSDWSRGAGAIGYMKSSPNRKHLAVAVDIPATVEILDFNASNGTISNPYQLYSSNENQSLYGLSFSPGSCLIYLINNDTLAQYDLTLPDSIQVIKSRKIINVPQKLASTAGAALQIGPDGRIYSSRVAWLGAIKHPDMRGLAAAYDPFALPIIDPISAGLGLPNMIDSWFAQDGRCNPPELTPFTSDTVICAGTSARFAVPWVERTDVSIRWEFPGGFPNSSTDTVAVVTYTTPGNFPVRIHWNDRVNGPDSASGTIRVLPLPIPFAGNDTSICAGDPLELKASVDEAHSIQSLKWAPSTDFDCDSCPVVLVYPSQPTHYILTLIDINGCVAYDTIFVDVRLRPVADIRADTTICTGDAIRLQAYPTAQTADRSFQWFPAYQLDCDTCFAVTARPLTTTTYTVTITNDQGCSTTDSVTIFVQSGGTLTVSNDTTFCRGGSAALRARGSDVFLWSPSIGLSCTDCPNPIATPETSTTYYVIGRGLNSECPALDSVTITIIDPPHVEAGNDTTLCLGEALQLQGFARGEAGEALTYKWTPEDALDNPTSLRPIATPLKTTTYVLTVISEHGCVDSDSLTVTLNSALSVDAGTDQSLCLGDSTTLAASDGTRWNWQPARGLSCTDCPQPTVTPEQTTTYHLTAWNAQGCSAIDSVTIVVRKPQLVRAFIRRDFRGLTDQPILFPVELRHDTKPDQLNDLSVILTWDQRILQVDPNSISRLLAGTALRDWMISIEEAVPGRLQILFTSPANGTLGSSDTLFVFEGRLYLAGVHETEIPVSLNSEGSCLNFKSEPGHAELDSICGLNFRLIESTAAKFLPPSVFPNPAQGRVQFSFGIGLNGPTKLEVSNLSGNRVALILNETLDAGFYSVEWDVSDISSGTYFYHLISGHWSTNGQIQVQR